jgi:hypothetical protein
VHKRAILPSLARFVLKSAVGQVGLPPQWGVKFSLTTENTGHGRYVPDELNNTRIVVRTSYKAEHEIVLTLNGHFKNAKKSPF